ncbi:AP-3 complex subunit beta-2, partial [Homalodisca vitripennis]
SNLYSKCTKTLVGAPKLLYVYRCVRISLHQNKLTSHTLHCQSLRLPPSPQLDCRPVLTSADPCISSARPVTSHHAVKGTWSMFEPFLKSFFVRTSDPTHIKLLKLEILTNLATESSISFILREFQTYISNPDKEFVAATIQAIGR